MPINHLVRIPSTPLENAPPVDELDFIRCVALARILMPKSYVRLSGGRVQMSKTMQTLCFMAGANSIHQGSKKLLVTPNVALEDDNALLKALNITAQPVTTPLTPSTIPCVTLR